MHNGVGAVVLLDDHVQCIATDGRCLGVHVETGSFKGDMSLVAAQFVIVLQILLVLAFANFIEGRLGNKDVAAINQLSHLSEEESQQQCPDMRPVDVCVGHDDDAVIAKVCRGKFLIADSTTQGLDQCADLCRAQHLVKTRLLNIENLAFQRKDCLILSVAALFG